MSMYKSLSLQQTADLIAAIGDKQTVLASGEMGIGKSSILKMLKAMPKFKDHLFCYVDITTKDVGDFMVPKIRTIDGVEVCSFIPNEEFGLHFKGKKVVMMLDELGKAKGGVMNACLRLMQERSLGVYDLDGVVFATTNLCVCSTDSATEPPKGFLTCIAAEMMFEIAPVPSRFRRLSILSNAAATDTSNETLDSMTYKMPALP